MIGHIVARPVMLSLGSFQFGISTAAYQELTRRSGYRWPGQDRFGVAPSLQFTGPETESTSLTGVIYTEYRGGTGQLDALRSLAGGGRPLRLVDGTGRMLGQWVIEAVEEKQTVFAAFGVPRKQEFSLQLKKFPDSLPGAANVLTAVAAAAGVPGSAPDANTVDGAKSAAGKFLENAGKSVSGAVGSMTSAMTSIQAQAAAIGNAVAPTIAAVSRGISTARNLQQQIESTKSSLGNMKSLSNVQSAMYGIMNAAGVASNAGSIAAQTSKALGIQIGTPGFDPASQAAAKECETASGQLAVASTSTYSRANQLAASMAP